jgi:hypothetical protein
MLYFRNGFSNTGVGESTGYSGHGHTHLPAQQQQQQETVQSHPQPSPRPINHQVPQENHQQQPNGGNVTNQQQVKPTAPVQQQPTSTTEGQRPEGSK